MYAKGPPRAMLAVGVKAIPLPAACISFMAAMWTCTLAPKITAKSAPRTCRVRAGWRHALRTSGCTRGAQKYLDGRQRVWQKAHTVDKLGRDAGGEQKEEKDDGRDDGHVRVHRVDRDLRRGAHGGPHGHAAHLSNAGTSAAAEPDGADCACVSAVTVQHDSISLGAATRRARTCPVDPSDHRRSHPSPTAICKQDVDGKTARKSTVRA